MLCRLAEESKEECEIERRQQLKQIKTSSKEAKACHAGPLRKVGWLVGGCVMAVWCQNPPGGRQGRRSLAQPDFECCARCE